VRRLDRQIKTASQAIRTAVREHGTTLTQVFGVGPVLAAKLLGHAGDIGRFPSRDHFASYTGTAPIDASSGDVRRHRLNRGGNRQLNTALHLIAVCQIRDPSPGQCYYRRKLAQAKTPEEPAAASSGTSPTSSPATWSPITATAHGAVDTQRRYQATFARPVGASGHPRPLADRSTSRHQAGETSGQTSPEGTHPNHRREKFLYTLKAGPAGGRRRRPPSRRQHHDAHLPRASPFTPGV
jgi:hypothetical protein